MMQRGTVPAPQQSDTPGQSEVLETSQQAITNWPPAGKEPVTNTTRVMTTLYTGKIWDIFITETFDSEVS